MSGYTAFARFYDYLNTDVDYNGRAAKWDALVREHGNGGKLLLDLACGTGGFSLEFAGLGYDVTGVDASAEMLSMAMQKAGPHARHILFLQQDMRELDLYGTVDVALCALDSLNHLPDEISFQRTVERVALFLAGGGVFLFDLNTAYKHRRVLGQNTFVYDLPQVYCVWSNRYGGAGGRLHIALDFFVPDAQGRYARESECFSERLFLDDFVRQCLAENGLALVQTLDGDTFAPPANRTQRLLYVTKKIR